MASSGKSNVTTAQILVALHSRYQAPEWAAFEEMRGGTGRLEERRIDFWAMNCFPSKGLRCVAYEVKVSRSDWLRELQKPHKRELAWEVSNEAWFVTAPGVVKNGEVPEGWGHMVCSQALTMKRMIAAQQRERPALGDVFMAAVARRSSRQEGFVPPWAREAFKFHGRELSMADLIRVGELTAKDALKRKRKAIADEVRVEERARHQELEDLAARVREVCGSPLRYAGETLASRFDAWRGNGGLSVLMTRMLRNLIANAADLGTALDREE